MVEKIIPPHLLEKLNELGTLALNMSELREQAKKVMEEVIVLGRNAEFSDLEIGDLVRQALKNRGVTDRSAFRLLPDHLKNPVRVKGGKNHNKNKEQDTPVDSAPVSQDPVPVVEQKPRSPDAVAADKQFEKEVLEENFALKAKVLELQSKPAGRNTCKIPKKLFPSIARLLRNDVSAVELTFDPATGEVTEVERVN